MSQQIGEFELNYPGMCKDCPYQKLDMSILTSFMGGDKIAIYCKHRDICNRIYDMDVEEETPIEVSYDPDPVIKCVNVKCEKCRSTFSIPDGVKIYNFCPKCGSKWNLTSRQMEYILHEQMYFKTTNGHKDDGGDYE